MGPFHAAFAGSVIFREKVIAFFPGLKVRFASA